MFPRRYKKVGKPKKRVKGRSVALIGSTDKDKGKKKPQESTKSKSFVSNKKDEWICRDYNSTKV